MLKTAPKKLVFELCSVSDLTPDSRARMYDLMSSNYASITPEIFSNDLAAKDQAGLLKDEHGIIQGFTTLLLFEVEYRDEPINVVFSGDTIIAPEYWGSQELVRGFCHTVGRILERGGGKRLYWLLISKGHRTYMYLPLFTRVYYPARDGAESERLKPLVDQLALRLFPAYWQASDGVLRFDQRRGELNAELARSTFEKKQNRHVAFFLERNPRFFEGEELVCLTELSPQNLKSVARAHLIAGMKDERENSQ